ncbi:MBL fold metallo-hydrolase [Enterobacter hormaechei]|uniref:MBL fold metallo-hydrolase n=1 Tax=Enterobacter hormaechei TaxID=158836 RepID=UPI001E544F49|nr:MBL fold metallo-hydrolase [Enterobacter hormaechei]MCC4567405.1 MBL fold metallo-hydrolase [Enterobacter hormaechei subsp. hoffmannii]MCC4571950.1 MBL fold metallo-hydrolase [Enterobacter hormaechei subsp. hoffmannii]MCC4576496.1 MBL fold metallo-hydrolase [Enterobacter hormaechei subsp. hoffmannii]MCC4581042.1 MBL fold metallo-hydrolase [Enterobacter hormaechei subsp. hoffmannii]MCE1615830.1 MBL fold metallo-hydrolase [Enterobacter hormaechei]
MNITQIRNATQLITYAGKRFLIDPMLAPKGAYPGFPGTARADIRNPMVELPVDVQTLLDTDAVIVTHTHDDHWDQYAVELIAKHKPIYVQNDSDAALLRGQGFHNLTVMTDETTFGDIRIAKTYGGQHGTDRAYAVPELAERLGEACGVVFRHPDEKTLYIAGDTIWRDAVAADLQKHQPDVVVLSAGYAHVIGFGPIIMGEEDLLNVHFLLPQAKIVATHMEAINHCLLTRRALREYVDANEISDAVSIPQDGETVIF